jgi:DNA repair exonuclease SbcCD ATPase subunit
MSDDQVKQALAELQDDVRCRCHPAYKDRGLHDPDCNCDSAGAVQVVTDRIQELEAKLQDMALDCLAAQGQAAENFQMYVDANEARIDAEARIEELEVELKTLRTEKHADAEAIGSLRDKLAEVEKVRGASA